MMNWLSRFDLILLVLVVTAACAPGREEISLVTSDAYAEESCWFDSRGNFVAFLALATDGSLAVPHFISRNCLVDDNYSSYGEALLLHLGTIDMIDSQGNLQRAFPDFSISDNIRTDLPLPSSRSKVYLFRARVETVQNEPQILYSTREVLELRDTNMSFEYFLDLSKEQREMLLREF